jgi:SAM-dependent methyltransferase
MYKLVHTSEDLQQLYRTRFAGKAEYRQKVWRVLCSFFSQWISPEDTVLDLGSGFGEFINAIHCRRKYAMDLNPDAVQLVNPEVTMLQQDCSEAWQVEPNSLDAVFTSNFFEHLPTKAALERTLLEAQKALRPGKCLIAMGPNIKFVPGQYWDFYDHYLPLTELSLVEVLKKCGFEIKASWDRFLPYTMSDDRQYPLWTLRAYLAMPMAWKVFGKQFLVVAEKKRSL